jgi:hypothetical protein
MIKSLKKLVAITLIATTAHLGFVGAVQAAMVDTGAAVPAAESRQAAVEAARARLATFLERADVTKQLGAMGIRAEEARARADALSDNEVLAASDRLDHMPAGGDALGAILGVAVLVFIVLLITDILGLTKVFSFTKSIRR